MPFDPSSISNVTATTVGLQLIVSWQSTAPAGTTFQVYLDNQLSWYGIATSCKLPLPPNRVWIDVGTVLSSEFDTDQSALLAPLPGVVALLSWAGGTYLSPAIDHFAICASPSPGAAVNLTNPVATVIAYPAGVILDGYGDGGYGDGGYGESANYYEWTSEPLASGVWKFAVITVNIDGTQSVTSTASVTIAGPPPAPQNLTMTYNPTTRVATLNWVAG